MNFQCPWCPRRIFKRQEYLDNHLLVCIDNKLNPKYCISCEGYKGIFILYGKTFKIYNTCKVCNDGKIRAMMRDEIHFRVSHCASICSQQFPLMALHKDHSNNCWRRFHSTKQNCLREQRIINKNNKILEKRMIEKTASIKIKTYRSSQALLLLMEMGLTQDIAWQIVGGAYWLLYKAKAPHKICNKI